MKQFCFLICVSFAMLSTQGCTQAEVKVTAPKKGQEKVTANSKLSMEIEGMVCEKGCGASIRKALKATDGVASCTFDFEEDRKTNVAVVAFDKDKVTADKIIEIVTSINEKQFSVSGSSSSRVEMKVQVQEGENAQSSDETAKVNVSEGGLEMPNLIKLFTGLLEG